MSKKNPTRPTASRGGVRRAAAIAGAAAQARAPSPLIRDRSSVVVRRSLIVLVGFLSPAQPRHHHRRRPPTPRARAASSACPSGPPTRQQDRDLRGLPLPLLRSVRGGVPRRPRPAGRSTARCRSSTARSTCLGGGDPTSYSVRCRQRLLDRPRQVGPRDRQEVPRPALRQPAGRGSARSRTAARRLAVEAGAKSRRRSRHRADQSSGSRTAPRRQPSRREGHADGAVNGKVCRYSNIEDLAQHRRQGSPPASIDRFTLLTATMHARSLGRRTVHQIARPDAGSTPVWRRRRGMPERGLPELIRRDRPRRLHRRPAEGRAARPPRRLGLAADRLRARRAAPRRRAQRPRGAAGVLRVPRLRALHRGLPRGRRPGPRRRRTSATSPTRSAARWRPASACGTPS